MIDAGDILLRKGAKKATPLILVAKSDLAAVLRKAGPGINALSASLGFDGSPLSILPIHNTNGTLRYVYVGAPSSDADGFSLGGLAGKLPPGHYAFAATLPTVEHVALAWCLELYRYDPFRAVPVRKVTLEIPDAVVRGSAVIHANATFLVRDLINAPANLMGPQELESVARNLAKTHGAKLTVTAGVKLKREFPLIHVVGAASPRPPRLIDFIWGRARDPKVTLVGKGVCFDTGGLDIKPSSGMLLMKKDMGGAATVLGLARMIMELKLPVRLRVLIPAVENSIAGDAFRPGDVFTSRKGLTVEIGNTDAEGRLILADALALADEESPDLLIDMATLTGAARVALGPDLPPFYTDDDGLAEDITRCGTAQNDPVWRMPLWRPYSAMFESAIADMNNAGAGGFAGSITAALFLRRFVERAKHHVHFDIFGWVPTAKPGRPKGGDAQAMRALLALLKIRYTN
jgi:leucyl aminopeptidase